MFEYYDLVSGQYTNRLNKKIAFQRMLIHSLRSKIQAQSVVKVSKEVQATTQVKNVRL